MESLAAEPIHVAYFGTPDYAVPALTVLAADPRVCVDLVITQPDRPVGRGRKLTAPPVKLAAEALGFDVYQPESLRTAGDREPIERVQADLFIVAAFGKIFGPRLLALPRLGSVNLHASILPDYRGASPISAAILEGQFRTGITLMQMDTGLDTGPILAQRSIDILSADTTASLTPRLARLGAELLIDSLDQLIEGGFLAQLQDEADATITRPMVKADGWIDWTRSARDIERQVRAMWDWPRAWTTMDGMPLQIHRAAVGSNRSDKEPGSVLIGTDGVVVATGDGDLVIEVAQLAGGKPLLGAIVLEDAVRGQKRLGIEGEPVSVAGPLIRPVTL